MYNKQQQGEERKEGKECVPYDEIRRKKTRKKDEVNHYQV